MNVMMPCCDWGHLIIELALEMAQACLFILYSGFSSVTVGLFSWFAILQCVLIIVQFTGLIQRMCHLETPKRILIPNWNANGKTVIIDGETVTITFLGAVFVDGGEEGIHASGVFLSSMLSMAIMQGIWLLLDVTTPLMGDVAVTVFTWAVGLLPVEGLNKKTLHLITCVGFPVLLLITELVLVDKWDLLVTNCFGSRYLAFMIYDAMMLLACLAIVGLIYLSISQVLEISLSSMFSQYSGYHPKRAWLILATSVILMHHILMDGLSATILLDFVLELLGWAAVCFLAWFGTGKFLWLVCTPVRCIVTPLRRYIISLSKSREDAEAAGKAVRVSDSEAAAEDLETSPAAPTVSAPEVLL